MENHIQDTSQNGRQNPNLFAIFTSTESVERENSALSVTLNRPWSRRKKCANSTLQFFHSGSKCWEAERCKFSHDPLTAETWNLLQTVLNPPPEDSIQQSEVTNPLQADTQTAAANQNTSNTNSWSEDTSPVSASSTYNFRESTRKRSLDTNEARDCHVTGEDKSSRKESPRKKDGRGSFFVPGMYKDTSVWTFCTIIRDVFAVWCTTLLTKPLPVTPWKVWRVT